MPGFDGTGPMGHGPRTGKAFGRCSMGFHRGAGRGMGFRGYAYQPTREQEVADLRAEKEAIEQELDAVKQRLKELETKKQ